MNVNCHKSVSIPDLTLDVARAQNPSKQLLSWQCAHRNHIHPLTRSVGTLSAPTNLPVLLLHHAPRRAPGWQQGVTWPLPPPATGSEWRHRLSNDVRNLWEAEWLQTLVNSFLSFLPFFLFFLFFFLSFSLSTASFLPSFFPSCFLFFPFVCDMNYYALCLSEKVAYVTTVGFL